MKKYIAIICKNCGKKTKTKIPKAELCSIPCIRVWREEEEYAKVGRLNRTDHS